jgi:MFS transporter, DHA1 family, tetracycline resistance protein
MYKRFQSQKASMPFILITVLIDMIAIGLMIPVLPALVGSFSTSQTDQAYWYGVAAFAFGFANFLTSPLIGAMSDQYGRRPLLLIGFLGLAISFFGTALSNACKVMRRLLTLMWPTSRRHKTELSALV